MSKTPERAELLDRNAAIIAGIMSVLLALLGLAAGILYTLSHGDQSLLLNGLGAIKLVFLVVVIAAGIQLVRGQIWAQRFLLIVALGGLVWTMSVAVAEMLWGAPSWWNLEWSMIEVLSIAGILQMIAVILLVRASRSRSRLRYATYVAISIAAAMGLTLVVNMFCQKDENYFRADVETFERFALSQRTKRVLDAVETPIRLTCMYAGIDEKDETLTRRARVMELLEEMREHNRNIQIANVFKDVEKAKLIERLRAQTGGNADKHVQLLERFKMNAPQIIAGLTGQQQQWEQVLGKSYLDLWGLTAEVFRLLSASSQEIQKTADDVQNAVSGSEIPEYTKLVEDVKKTLRQTREILEKIVGRLNQVTEIPKAVRNNRDTALQSADEALQSVFAMIETIGKTDDDELKDPGPVLQKFAEAAHRAAKLVITAGEKLSNVAGKQYAPFVRASQVWLVRGSRGRKAVLPDGRIIDLGRTTITDLFAGAARTITEFKEKAYTFRQAAKAEYQSKFIKQLRKPLENLAQSLAAARASAETAIDQLADVDDPTQTLLEQTREGKAFNQPEETITSLLDAIEQLPKLESGSIGTEISGENVVLIEVNNKAAVINFESIWPLKVRPTGFETNETHQGRVFDGDSVISSAILSMTHEPFATVVITYYQPDVTPELARMLPPAEISPTNLTALRKRLGETNFKVAEWNLSQDRPTVDDSNRPQVLVVLPPAFIPPMPVRGAPQIEPFGPKHMDKIRNAIDEGTPAIFLSQFFAPRRISPWSPPVQPPNPHGQYLKENWGIDVRTDYMVIPAVPDKDTPGKFKIDPSRFSYLPLSTFSSHPIGRFLQGQRTLWSWVAPVDKIFPLPPNVTVEPLLSVPESWKTTWATKRVSDLIAQFMGNKNSFIAPDYSAGDLPAGFDVAVAATRTDSDNLKPARIVVLGVGAGLIDGYLDGRVAKLNADGTISLSDPPRTNADLLTNSVYWLIGRDRYIARGPAQIQPVAMIPRGKLTFLWILCVIALPIGIVAMGGVVLFVRSR